jgi:aminoglycoside 3-N-acetyltransferase I
VRLTAADVEQARQLFAVMAEVFGEDRRELSRVYLERVLSRGEFWALAALRGEVVVGGLTAHALPMTRDESWELFIYDIAVTQAERRRGVGRLLVEELHAAAAHSGIEVSFVAADDGDTHALDFYRALGGSESPVTFFTFGDSGE